MGGIFKIILLTIGCFLWSCIDDEAIYTDLSINTTELPDQISYNYHIKPIISDRCFNCHGPDKAKIEAGLRLDQPSSAYAELIDNPGRHAIRPKRPDASELVKRILHADPERLMPPPESKLSLTDFEKALLIKWIDQGAKYEKHWSFNLPKQELPNSEVHPIDFYIDQKLATLDLERNKAATKESLIRRASFDLTGLPPTISEIDAFLKDNSANAFETLIDDLISRPSYGERMAADWMDVARYADSDGYLDDKHRDFTPWRDWVIRAFNDNMPYNEFASMQIAGDLFPNASQENVLATAFNRLHRKNSEAGIVFEEYRVEYVADRTHTFGKAFLGLTVECARCHDHKYDPISQKEYYELFAFFNSTDETGTAIYGPDQTPGPSLLLSTPKQEEILSYIQAEIRDQEEQLAQIGLADKISIKGGFDVGTIDNCVGRKLVAHHGFDRVARTGENVVDKSKNGPGLARLYDPNLDSGVVGEAFYVDDYNYVILPEKVGWYDRDDAFSVSLWIKPAQNYAEAGIFTHCEDLRLGYKGYSLHLQNNRLQFIMAHSWPFNAIEVVSEEVIPVDKWSHIAITYDGSSEAKGVRLFLDGQPLSQEVIVDRLYKGILFEPNIHTYGFAGFRLGYRDKIKNLKGGAIDEVKIFNDRLSELEVRFDYDPSSLNSKLSDNHFGAEILREFKVLNEHPSYRSLRKKLLQSRRKLTAQLNGISEVMVMGDCEPPRPTYLLDRGQYDQPGQQVFPSTFSALAPEFQFEKNRLGLTKWLFHPDNPLAARVYVNRIWQQHFGVGLVKTAEDLGAQGTLPSHPDLLDYLSNFFREHDWDIKKLHKLILTSQAYQRSSIASAMQSERDPENTWLARGPSQRLTAEMIRDNALAISGLLVSDLGGPSVYPYQPAGLWDEVSNKSWRYPYLQEPGPGLYRRSLYTIWKRTVAPPSMLLFDVPDRSFCTVQRNQTNTPLQALAILNDPHYLEAAREVAIRTIDVYPDLTDRLRHVFRLTLGRRPDNLEWKALLDFYGKEYDLFTSDRKKMEVYLRNGELGLNGDHDKEDVAALAVTVHNLLNTYEAQMKK